MSPTGKKRRPSAPETRDAERIAERIAALQRLGETTGEDLLRQVVKSFLGRGARHLEAMAESLAREDGRAFADAAHSLAGTSGLLGALGLAERCVQLETLALTGNLQACEPTLQAARQEFRAVAAKLRASRRSV